VISAIAIAFVAWRGNLERDAAQSALPMSALAGVLVIVAVAGVSYSVPRIGVAAGTMALLFGQTAIAFLIDTIGGAGYDKVPMTLPRIAGLVLMVIGIYLVLPRQG
jgi:transporter family-2 protein